MNYKAININNKFNLFNERWSPKVIAEINNYQFKITKLKGDFQWHSHKDTDEAFIIVEGNLRIDFRDGFVNLSKGEMYVVPKGVEHKPYAKDEAKIMLIEPRGVVNTGNLNPSELTAENDIWI
ncbi:MAG: cupin domain-containing protein [Flavobacteriaceae bacterium]|jgi:mannose-6-phosphate isomerase-like protein (cupin superfamily)|nr:cupin domain-containing protein [Flavobacteriaceae bacterium]MBT4063109.1 cupin domain-containing protein [Flavobacteriaceae bacterium]MBT4245830.1 cupin domain-containing protein [Flavobacteriaceae bacterium]MBT5395907.1 cupin domain-containing protein [Flavobacteriaceae bacterium]MBT7553970.1 cupin domain-containing protein [Flavobacteriaceae bacterium]